MDIKKMFSGLTEKAFAVISDLVIFGILGRKDGKGKVMSQEEAQKILKGLAPHMFGLGPEDEAIFSSTMAKLEDRRQVKLARWLDKLKKHDRAKLAIILSVLPEEENRISILNMLTDLDEKEMTQVAVACRLITNEPSVLHHLVNHIIAVGHTADGINQSAAQAAQEISTWLVVRRELPRVNEEPGECHQSLWTRFASKHRGLF